LHSETAKILQGAAVLEFVERGQRGNPPLYGFGRAAMFNAAESSRVPAEISGIFCYPLVFFFYFL
jgi:hypothetical protein